jgi:tRNA (guanine37-N1)-methyltransferase
MQQSKDLCLKVNKKMGEKIRKILINMNLFDDTRKIISENDYIIIPILRYPSEEELDIIKNIAEVEIIDMELPSHKKRFKNLIEVLDGRLPPYLLTLLPRSYDIIGDIGVIEDLSDELLPYKEIIGKALMELHSNLKTVLLKVEKVSGKYRLPKYEVIAGEEKYTTIHTEYGIKLKVNLQKAYYSPRLATEHNRVASQVKDGEVVVDMFSGIGPFALHIAKRVFAKVYAIDINPDAVNLIKENIKINKIKGEIIPLCGDVRSFSDILKRKADRVIMNLPGEAMEYIDLALNFIKENGGVIHFYAFSKDIEETKTHLISKLSTRKLDIINMKKVREVSPREWQIVIDLFVIP